MKNSNWDLDLRDGELGESKLADLLRMDTVEVKTDKMNKQKTSIWDLFTKGKPAAEAFAQAVTAEGVAVFYQACSDLYDAIVNGRIVHAGQQTLVDSMNNCAAKESWLLAENIKMIALKGDKRLSYIIHQHRIASPRQNWAWRVYKGSNPHVSHLHISFTKAGDLNGKAFGICKYRPRSISVLSTPLC